MNYQEMARECERDAENLKKVIDKYKSQLKDSRGINREEMNAKIFNFELIYHELIGKANWLRKKGAK